MRRFDDEVNRIYGVLNNRLYDRPYLAGDEYTIADMISYPWTVGWKIQGQDIDDFKYFKRWFEELSERPAVKRGMAVGSDFGNDRCRPVHRLSTLHRSLQSGKRHQPGTPSIADHSTCGPHRY